MQTASAAGAGTGPHLAMEVFAQRTGIKIQQIVYKGGGPAMIDFLAGQTQINLANMMTAMPHVRTGRRGDQIVIVHVVTPTKLTPEQRKSLEVLA